VRAFLKNVFSHIENCSLIIFPHPIYVKKNNTDKEIWEKHCLLPEYRGLNGCERCKMEFWKKEYTEPTP